MAVCKSQKTLVGDSIPSIGIEPPTKKYGLLYDVYDNNGLVYLCRGRNHSFCFIREILARKLRVQKVYRYRNVIRNRFGACRPCLWMELLVAPDTTIRIQYFY